MSPQLTQTEKDFIAYLRQRRIPFKREPFNDLGPCPDFLITVNKKRTLVEVKEVEATPFNRAIEATRGVEGTSTFSLDPRNLYDMLRERIKEAASQLKPYASRVDYTAIIFGFPNQFRDVTLDDVFYAMYGDPVLTFHVDRTGTAPPDDVAWSLADTGQLRRLSKKSGVLYTRHEYLGGVGIVTTFKGQAAYERRYLSRLKRKPKDAHAFFNYVSERWAAHLPKIPKLYRDPAREFVKVEVVANPLGQLMLPREVFNGRWDLYREPNVVVEYQDVSTPPTPTSSAPAPKTAAK